MSKRSKAYEQAAKLVDAGPDLQPAGGGQARQAGIADQVRRHRRGGDAARASTPARPTRWCGARSACRMAPARPPV